MALLFCKSEEAIETFIARRDIAARDLLMPYGDVVMVLSIVLHMKRTLDAAEIDKIIWDVEARRALAAEHRRRAEWRKAEVEADRFRAVCELLGLEPLSVVLAAPAVLPTCGWGRIGAASFNPRSTTMFRGIAIALFGLTILSQLDQAFFYGGHSDAALKLARDISRAFGL